MNNQNLSEEPSNELGVQLYRMYDVLQDKIKHLNL